MKGAPTQVIVLNGGSSSGKTGIARCLQAILPWPWLRLGVDDLLAALPPSLLEPGSGIAFGQQGDITVGGGFRDMEAAWMTGVAAMARAGVQGPSPSPLLRRPNGGDAWWGQERVSIEDPLPAIRVFGAIAAQEGGDALGRQ